MAADTKAGPLSHGAGLWNYSKLLTYSFGLFHPPTHLSTQCLLSIYYSVALTSTVSGSAYTRDTDMLYGNSTH